MEYPNVVVFGTFLYRFDEYVGDGLDFEPIFDGYPRKVCIFNIDENTSMAFDLESGMEIHVLNFDDINCDVYEQDIFYDQQADMIPFSPTRKEYKKISKICNKILENIKLENEGKLVKFRGKLIYKKDSYYR